MRIKKIQHNGKILVLKVKELDEMGEINIDKLLQIDFQRIVAEVVTFPVMLNKLGLALAEADNKLAEAKLDLEIYIAKKREQLRSSISGTQDDIRYKTDALLKGSTEFMVRNKVLLKAQKERDYINSVYWSAKDKSDKLNKLSEKIHPEDMDMHTIDQTLEGEINGITVRVHNNLIK